MDQGYRDTGSGNLVSALRSEDYFETLQALSTLFETLTFDSTAIFEYARPMMFIPALVPLLDLNWSCGRAGSGSWEMSGEVAIQAARCLGFYLEALPETTSELIVNLGGARFLMRWLESLDQVEFAEIAVETLSSVVKEQRLALYGGTVGGKACTPRLNREELQERQKQNNPIIVILNILEFLPLETQEVALETAYRSCVHVPSRYWPLLVEATPFIVSLIGRIEGRGNLVLGHHAKMGLNLCLAAFGSICHPQVEVREGVSQLIHREGKVEELVTEMAKGLPEIGLALIEPEREYNIDILCSMIQLLTLLVQKSEQLRNEIGGSSYMVSHYLEQSLSSAKTSKEDHLRMLMFALLHELLGYESIVPSSCNMSCLVKVVDPNGCFVFGGYDGDGKVQMLEYGRIVPLLLTTMSNSGEPRHLIGVPPKTSLAKTAEEVSPIEILGWVTGSPFASMTSSPVVYQKPPQQLLCILCTCVDIKNRIEPLTALELSLLNRMVQVVDRLEEAEVIYLAEVLGSFAWTSPSLCLHATSIVESLVASSEAERCLLLGKHGLWSRLSAVAKLSLSNIDSVFVMDRSLWEQCQSRATCLINQIKHLDSSNPLAEYCTKLSTISDEMNSIDSTLRDILNEVKSVTPYQWISSKATEMLIDYFQGEESNDQPSLKCSRIRSFLEMCCSSSSASLSDLLRLLHRCIVHEVLGSRTFKLVFSKAMGGNPPPISPSPTEPQPERGRLAKRLADLGVLSRDPNLSPEATQPESPIKHVDIKTGADQSLGFKSAFLFLKQPLQLLVKMTWLHAKRRSIRRGKGVSHSIPMMVEPTTVLGTMVDYAMSTAYELGIATSEIESAMRDNEGKDTVFTASVGIAGKSISCFKLFCQEDRLVFGRPHLVCQDSASALTMLHILHAAQVKTMGTNLMSDNTGPHAPSPRLWDMTHGIDITISCVTTPQPSPQTVFEDKNRILTNHSPYTLGFRDNAASMIGSATVVDILRLMKMLENAVGKYQRLFVDTSEAKEDNAHRLPQQSEWVNHCISRLFSKQLSDPIVLSCVAPAHPDTSGISSTFSPLPPWMKLIAKWVPFCLPLDLRMRWVHSTCFGSPHALRTLYNKHKSELSSSRKLEKDEIKPPIAPKVLVCVDRQSEKGVLLAGMRGYRQVKARRERDWVTLNELEGGLQGGPEDWEYGLQFEASFESESGSGAGPTAEFYSLLSSQMATVSMQPAFWRDVNTSDFFPWSLSDNSIIATSPSYLEMMGLLGWMLMQALQDNHLIDLPLALPLLSILSNGHDFSRDRADRLNQLRDIDAEFAKQLEQLEAMAVSYNRIAATTSDCDPIEMMSLDWTLPGRADISLKKDAESYDGVTCKNFSIWMDRVLEVCLLQDERGREMIEYFQSGARIVGDPSMLACFQPWELRNILLGDVHKNLPLGCDPQHILKLIDTAHGYSHDSPAVVSLTQVLAQFSWKEQTAFVQFVTGASRLPMGGLQSLSPKLTVVAKSTGSSRQELPSASTCTNYLKLPDYGSNDVLKERLLVAIFEGQGAFLLS